MQKRTVLQLRTASAWFCALLLYFPIFWLGLMAFKTEAQAISTPPLFFFSPTLQSFRDVMARDNYTGYALNSLFTSVLSTAIGLAIALPAAYSMAFFRPKAARVASNTPIAPPSNRAVKMAASSTVTGPISVFSSTAPVPPKPTKSPPTGRWLVKVSMMAETPLRCWPDELGGVDAVRADIA